MPRIPRKYSQSNFYHIMVQGINKEYIFNTEQNMKKWELGTVPISHILF